MGLLAMMAVNSSNTFACLILSAHLSALFLVKWCTNSVAAKIVLSSSENCWHFAMGWIEFDGVGDASRTGVVDELLAASIMMHGRSEITAVDCM